MNNRSKPILLILLLTSFSSSQAGIVTVNGNSVSFSYDNTLLDLFGSPTIAGDQLFFTPTNFDANASGLTAFDLKYSTINIKVTALNGGEINTVNVNEKGTYISKGSSSYVDAGGQIIVTDSNSPLTEVTDNLTLSTPFAHQASFFPTQNWQASAASNVSIFGTSSVNVNIGNFLIAMTNAFGELGFIQKSAVVLRITSVPLPTSVWLFGAALLVFLAYSKRIHYI